MKEANLEVLGTCIDFEQDYVTLNTRDKDKLNVIKLKNSKEPHR